ncbi:hypothetical protein B0H16DRAFT_1445935 [Mycena metata]|uniref:Uncharacterized protein n=1 Tax=Mycena metata TaxID=1033252 RepID=A0AAD7KJ40_9AGAR|nr:hypothetical protein B0H16DRAFT_1445935 [Mycena metata]
MTSIDQARCVLVIAAYFCRPTVIAAGRRQDRLKELAEKKLETLQIDVSADEATLKTTADSLVTKYLNLDAVILASGELACIQYNYDFTKEVELTSQNFVVQKGQHLTVLSRDHQGNKRQLSGSRVHHYMFLPHFLKLSVPSMKDALPSLCTSPHLRTCVPSRTPDIELFCFQGRVEKFRDLSSPTTPHINVVEISPPRRSGSAFSTPHYGPRCLRLAQHVLATAHTRWRKENVRTSRSIARPSRSGVAGGREQSSDRRPVLERREAREEDHLRPAAYNREH